MAPKLCANPLIQSSDAAQTMTETLLNENDEKAQGV